MSHENPMVYAKPDGSCAAIEFRRFGMLKFDGLTRFYRNCLPLVADGINAPIWNFKKERRKKSVKCETWMDYQFQWLNCYMYMITVKGGNKYFHVVVMWCHDFFSCTVRLCNDIKPDFRVLQLHVYVNYYDRYLQNYLSCLALRTKLEAGLMITNWIHRLMPKYWANICKANNNNLKKQNESQKKN